MKRSYSPFEILIALVLIFCLVISIIYLVDKVKAEKAEEEEEADANASTVLDTVNAFVCRSTSAESMFYRLIEVG